MANFLATGAETSAGAAGLVPLVRGLVITAVDWLAASALNGLRQVVGSPLTANASTVFPGQQYMQASKN